LTPKLPKLDSEHTWFIDGACSLWEGLHTLGTPCLKGYNMKTVVDGAC